MVKYEENCAMKDKIQSSDYAVYGNDCHLIIVITHNRYIFSANDGIYKAWT